MPTFAQTLNLQEQDRVARERAFLQQRMRNAYANAYERGAGEADRRYLNSQGIQAQARATTAANDEYRRSRQEIIASNPDLRQTPRPPVIQGRMEGDQGWTEYSPRGQGISNMSNTGEPLPLQRRTPDVPFTEAQTTQQRGMRGQLSRLDVEKRLDLKLPVPAELQRRVTEESRPAQIRADAQFRAAAKAMGVPPDQIERMIVEDKRRNEGVAVPSEMKSEQFYSSDPDRVKHLEEEQKRFDADQENEQIRKDAQQRLQLAQETLNETVRNHKENQDRQRTMMYWKMENVGVDGKKLEQQTDDGLVTNRELADEALASWWETDTNRLLYALEQLPKDWLPPEVQGVLDGTVNPQDVPDEVRDRILTSLNNKVMLIDKILAKRNPVPMKTRTWSQPDTWTDFFQKLASTDPDAWNQYNLAVVDNAVLLRVNAQYQKYLRDWFDIVPGGKGFVRKGDMIQTGGFPQQP